MPSFTELSFLTDLPKLNNNDNRDTIYNSIMGEFGIKDGKAVGPDYKGDNTIIFKSKSKANTSNIKDYYKKEVYRGENDKSGDKNQYLRLLQDFDSMMKNSKGESVNTAYKAMRFQPADFAYLTDLGIYPINRMWVLRRFEDETPPPDNLQNWGEGANIPFAKHTLVGWVNPNDDDFFGLNFSEKWVKVTDRLDEVIGKILDTEFGFKGASAVSLPGWSQGLMFGFLKQMGLTDYDGTKIPQGDPAFLQEAAARANSSEAEYCNVSTMNVKLETSFEQKFIGDVDPGTAMLDIFQKCLNMGTRDTKYVLNDTSGSNIINKLKAANNANDVTAWWDFIESVITAFINAIEDVFKGLVGKNSDTTTTTPTKSTTEEPKKNEETPTPKDAAGALTTSLTFIKSMGDSKIAKQLLASTVAKWRYALSGSIALMTGENSTPWHLTLGNPYSPFVSVGNIVVKDIKLKWNNEFAFNDIPTRIDVTIDVEFGRNKGAQELFKMFNNGYKRDYAEPKKTQSTNNNQTVFAQTQAEEATKAAIKADIASGNKSVVQAIIDNTKNTPSVQ